MTDRREAIMQRFDTGEHAQTGTDEIVHVNGVAFTRAQILTMGDFYATHDDMIHAPPAELRRLKAHIQQQTKFYRKEPGGVDIEEGKKGWDGDTGGRYLELAKRNDTHFAPGVHSNGRDHKTTWEENHRRALLEVRANARNAGSLGASPGVPESAKLINDFGNHFLTDAFSAGHLIAKADVMLSAEQNFGRLEETSSTNIVLHRFYTNAFTDAVAHYVMSDPDARRKLDLYQLKFVKFKDIDERRFSELLSELANAERDVIYSNFVKMVHDSLNHSIDAVGSDKDKQVRAIEGGGVLEVQNERGDKWILAGDTTLAQSPETLRIMRAAVVQTNTNLEDANQVALPPQRTPLLIDDFDSLIPNYLKNVWDFTPKPTEGGKKRLERTVNDSTDLKGQISAYRFARIAIAHLDDVIEKLVERGTLKRKSDLDREAREIRNRALYHPRR